MTGRGSNGSGGASAAASAVTSAGRAAGVSGGIVAGTSSAGFGESGCWSDIGDGDRYTACAHQNGMASKIASLEQFSARPARAPLTRHAYPLLGHFLHRDRQLRRHRCLLAAGPPAGAGARARGAAVGR
ncbi:exported hypothetical protein [Cupriavidus necator]|uniref:Uncharacterized protein n=1 Tax=Cupriavidus necator TaxID=106590 RepID=A0A1K0J761_CUPNE|nr:exported hypothetical protein [Cupriavidus necator]